MEAFASPRGFGENPNFQAQLEYDPRSRATASDKLALGRLLQANSRFRADQSLVFADALMSSGQSFGFLDNDTYFDVKAQLFLASNAKLVVWPFNERLLELPFARIVDQLNQGTEHLKLFLQPRLNGYALKPALARVDIARAADGSMHGELALASVSELAPKLWASSTPAIPDSAEKLLDLINTLLVSYGSPADANSLKDIVSQAEAAWNSAGPITHWKMSCLEFLNLINPAHPTHAIYEQFTLIRDKSVALDPTLALTRAVDLAQNDPVSDDQLKLVLSAYANLQSDAVGDDTVWTSALALAHKCAFDEACLNSKLASFADLFGWLERQVGQNSYGQMGSLWQKVFDWTLQGSFDAQAEDLFKSSYSWMASQNALAMTPDKALSNSETLMFCSYRALDASSLVMLEDLYAWLTSYRGAAIDDKVQVLDKIDLYYADRAISGARFDQLKQEFALALQDGLARDSALQRAEKRALGGFSLFPKRCKIQY
jgi:hypothetical protein